MEKVVPVLASVGIVVACVAADEGFIWSLIGAGIVVAVGLWGASRIARRGVGGR